MFLLMDWKFTWSSRGDEMDDGLAEVTYALDGTLHNK